MGQSVDAHYAFGWIMTEGWDDNQDEDFADDLWDHAVLSHGYAGSYYVGDMESVLYYKPSLTETSWCAKVAGLQINEAEAERKMREVAEVEFGMELPADPPQWILWPALS